MRPKNREILLITIYFLTMLTWSMVSGASDGNPIVHVHGTQLHPYAGRHDDRPLRRADRDN